MRAGQFASTFVAALSLSGALALGADYTYVADLDPAANYVTQVAPDGSIVRPWSSVQGNITGLASDGNGTLYAAHVSMGQLLLEKIGHGAITSTLITGAAGGPITLDPSGNVYLADGINTRILKITPSGTQTTYAMLPSNGLAGLAFGPDGNLYVSDLDDYAIDKVAPDGSFSTFASGIPAARGLAFGPDGTLYVANEGNYIPGVGPTLEEGVLKVNSAGQVSTLASLPRITDVAFDSAGNLLATNDGNYLSGNTSIFHDLSRIDTTTGAVTQISDQFLSPFLLATSPVQIIPEPVAIALMGAAALLLVRRRRGGRFPIA